MSKLFVFAVDEDAQIPHRLERVAEHFDADRRRSLRHVRVLRVPQVRRVREGEHHPQSAPGRSVSCVLRFPINNSQECQVVMAAILQRMLYPLNPGFESTIHVVFSPS